MLTSWLFGSNLSSLLLFRIRNVSFAGLGLFARTATMPAGKESIISPLSFTWHRVSSVPRKYEWIISWKATAKGIVSARPIVRGEGPLEDPTATPAVRNSRLTTLSARDNVAGEIRPRDAAMLAPSPRLDGGLGMAMDELVDCFGGKATLISPTSEKRSPSEINLNLSVKHNRDVWQDHLTRFAPLSVIRKPKSSLPWNRVCGLVVTATWECGEDWETANCDVGGDDNGGGLWSGAYGWPPVGVEALDGVLLGLKRFRPRRSELGFPPSCWETDCDLFIWWSVSVLDPLRPWLNVAT